MNKIRFLYFDREGLDGGIEKARSEYELTTQSSQLSPTLYPQGRGEKKINYQLGATLMSISLKSGGGGGVTTRATV